VQLRVRQTKQVFKDHALIFLFLQVKYQVFQWNMQKKYRLNIFVYEDHNPWHTQYTPLKKKHFSSWGIVEDISKKSCKIQSALVIHVFRLFADSKRTVFSDLLFDIFSLKFLVYVEFLAWDSWVWYWRVVLFCRVFHRFGQAKFRANFQYCPSCLKKLLNSKVAKIDPKIIISLCLSKSVTHSVAG